MLRSRKFEVFETNFVFGKLNEKEANLVKENSDSFTNSWLRFRFKIYFGQEGAKQVFDHRLPRIVGFGCKVWNLFAQWQFIIDTMHFSIMHETWPIMLRSALLLQGAPAKKFYNSSGGSRIFPRGGVNPPGGAWTRQIFPKTAWNRKNLDAQGGACVPHAPPRSANEQGIWNRKLFFPALLNTQKPRSVFFYSWHRPKIICGTKGKEAEKVNVLMLMKLFPTKSLNLSWLSNILASMVLEWMASKFKDFFIHSSFWQPKGRDIKRKASCHSFFTSKWKLNCFTYQVSMCLVSAWQRVNDIKGAVHEMPRNSLRSCLGGSPVKS